MIAVFTLLLVMGISLVIVRFATVALVHTGLGRETARFQARSAFTGAGFTTGESEQVVGHPVRRRIVMWLMLVGNIGIVTAMATLLLSFIDMKGTDEPWLEMGLLATGVVALWFLATSSAVDRHLCRIISWALNRYTDIDARDYARLLHLREDYGVSELLVAERNWLQEKNLREAALAREGILVLGIECAGGGFLGAPPADTCLHSGDRLLVYGRTGCIAALDQRPAGAAGDRDHADGVVDQVRVTAEERAQTGR
jgi:hypothetical protein